MALVVSNESSSCCNGVYSSKFRSWDLLSTDQHLHVEDTELFYHDDSSKVSWIRRATNDVKRDLAKKGIELWDLLDERRQAVIEVSIKSIGTDLGLPQGSILRESVDRKYGYREYALLDPVNILDGTTRTVQAIALDFGEPFNDVFGLSLVLLADENAIVDSIELKQIGCDHQLTLAATYRVMELVYMNYSRGAGDCFDDKKRDYRSLYKDEIDRSFSGGFVFDLDKNKVADGGARFPLRRLERG